MVVAHTQGATEDEREKVLECAKVVKIEIKWIRIGIKCAKVGRGCASGLTSITTSHSPLSLSFSLYFPKISLYFYKNRPVFMPIYSIITYFLIKIK